MSQLRGGGTIETFCPACGFSVRQSVARPVRQQRERWLARFEAMGDFGRGPPGDTQRPGFRFTTPNLVLLAAVALLMVAVRTMFVGYPSNEPVVFAELYVWAFCSLTFTVVLMRTIRQISGKQVLLLVAGGVAGIILLFKIVKLLKLLPTSWEPDYCANWNYPNIIDLSLPPKTFRCTSVPIGIAGWFLGWWVTYWFIVRWERQSRNN